MNAVNFREADRDLSQAFKYYETQQAGVGEEFIHEFRRAVERILMHPRAWTRIDTTHRRCLLDRFPYGIIYRIDAPTRQIFIVAVWHMKRHQDQWRSRD